MNTFAPRSFAPAVWRQIMETVTRKLDYVLIAAMAHLRQCGLPFIASGQDLDQGLSSLRQSALEELGKGHRISL